MSVEFFEPDPAGPSVHPPTSDPDAPSPAQRSGDVSDPAPRRPAGWLRSVALLWLAAAVLLAVAPTVSAYVYRQTAFIQDFDGVHPVVTDQPVDGFGHVARVSGLPRDASIAPTTEPAFGLIWIGLAAGLTAVAALSLWRPGGWTLASAAILAGAGAGSLGTMWLVLSDVGTVTVPNYRREVVPTAGFWLAVAGVLLAGLGAVAVAAIPRLHRTIGEARRRRAARRGRPAPA